MTKQLKFLVAEDNIINQRIVKELLVQLGHTGVMVGDGEKALLCLEKISFDCLLLDVMMPNLDGIETLKSIREKEIITRKHLPIIMATAHDEPGEATRFKKMGADGYVAKPISVQSLEQEIKRVANHLGF